jgi:hypothetical protein
MFVLLTLFPFPPNLSSMMLHPFNSCISSTTPRDLPPILTSRKQPDHRGVSFRLSVRHILAFALRSTIRHNAGGLLRNWERHIEETLEGPLL